MENNTLFNSVSISYSRFLSDVNKNQIDDSNQPIDFYHLIYLIKKRQSSIYKLIFFGISLIFLFLGCFVFYNTTNWACSLYFQNCAFIKAFIYSLCFSLSFSSFLLAFFIKPEKETVHYLVNRMEKSLKSIYSRMKQDIKEAPLNFYFDSRLKKDLYKQSFNQSLEKIHEQREQAIQLLDRIAYSKHYDVLTKNKLIDQSLFELQNKLNYILQGFKKKCYVLSLNQPNHTERTFGEV